MRRALRRAPGAGARRVGTLLLRLRQPTAAALLLRAFRAGTTLQALARRQLARGEELLRAGQHAMAEEPLRAATVLAPGDATAHRRLASCLIALERWKEAAALLERCRARFPGEPAFRAQLGAVLIELDRADAAVEQLASVADLPGGDPRWLRWYLNALVKSGRRREALAAVDRLLERGPKDKEALHTAALVNLGYGRADAAVDLLRRAVALDHSAKHAIWLARALVRAGRADEALEAARAAVDADPEVADASATLAEVLLELGRLDEAERAAAAAVRQAPDELGWHVLLARVHDARQEFDRSRRAMLDLVRRRRDPETIHVAAGYFAEAGDVRQALELAEQLVEIRGDSRSYVLLADYLQRLKRDEESVAALRRAVELDPGDAGARATMGSLLARQHRKPEAVEELEAAVALRPDRGKWRLKVATLLLDLGEVERARAHLGEVLDADPDDPTGREQLARALLLEGRPDEAERYIDHDAVEPQPAFIAFRHYLAGGRDERAFDYLAERHSRILQDVLASRTVS